MSAPKRKSARKAPAKKISRKVSSRKSSSKKSSSRKSSSKSCTRQSASKYTSRPSPPFPANVCRGMVMQGNDGKIYVSSGNKAGVYTWKLAK